MAEQKELVIVSRKEPDERANSDVFGGEYARWMLKTVDKYAGEGSFAESHIGFDATVLDAALKDTGCPVSVGELLDYVHDALHDQLQLSDNDLELQSWINKIVDQIEPETDRVR